MGTPGTGVLGTWGGVSPSLVRCMLWAGVVAAAAVVVVVVDEGGVECRMRGSLLTV